MIRISTLTGAAALAALAAVGSSPQQGTGSLTYVRLQTATPGIAQSGHLHIAGNGIFDGNVGIGQTVPSYKLDVQTGQNTGIRGWTQQASGIAFGGFFQTDSTSGRGIYAEASASSGTNYGGYFKTNSASGRAVYGEATYSGGGTESSYGGYFKANSPFGLAVFGANNTNDGTGIYTEALGNGGLGIFALAYGPGGGAIYAYGDRFGVIGEAGSSVFNSFGVKGNAFSGQTIGVWGNALGTSGAGIVGQGQTGGYFEATVGGTNAGWFQGDVQVTGYTFKGGGGFKIDHPLDPENKYLYHSFVESPDMKNIYDGNVVTDGRGYAVVALPEWFEAVNKDFRYQLTVIGDFAQAIIARKIQNNSFVIRTDKPNVEVSWQVTGIRKDAFAEAHRIPVEEEKEDYFRGYYLHPDAFGLPKSRRIALFDRELPVAKGSTK